MKSKSLPRKKKKRPTMGEPYPVTKAVTHIRLVEVNPGKLAALDALAPVYLALCQQYVTLFCSTESPNKLRDPLYLTPLSERWHRVAIMQAAGIAQAFRSHRANAHQQFQEDRKHYQQQKADGTLPPSAKEPEFHEWNMPTLREPCIQANVNVVKLERSEDSTYDYWLTISTLEKGQPIAVPVKLADYHKRALTDPKTGQARKFNSSVQLNKREGVWWLTLSYDEEIILETPPNAPTVGIDVGIANFVTTSTGKYYGSFHKKLRTRHKRDRAKRRRKAKLRACLKKKGVKKLPATSSRTGQKLIRQTRQAINHAVNQCFADPEHEGVQFAYEQLSVASMRFKARAQNAYLRASRLGQIPQQILWNSQKRGVQATPVISAYSSQECSVCHYTDRKNRPDQRTFHCQVCGFEAHADHNASVNISRRVGDRHLRACRDRSAIKAVLMQRHEAWKQQQGMGNTSSVKREAREGSPRLLCHP
ncbi:MAG TPA: transposase, partial [Ktedonobacteraceae bacterium]|nr:transposase [Ktedonobacteraceae bacterium]